MQERLSHVPFRLLLGTTWILGTAVAGVAPTILGTAPAWAQEDGGHEDGGHEDGGGGHGGGGHGGGGHGEPLPEEPPVGPAGDGSEAGTAAGKGGAAGAFSAGTYLRFELGAAQPGAGDANWLPPGFPGDPQVFFDLDLDTTALAAVAIGRSYGNGWRAEAALNIFGSADFSGSWSYTVPADPGPHADMEGSVRSVALFANGYYDFTMQGGATPFLTAGLGVARNTMGDWTRINPSAGRPTRSYEGGSDTGLAWSIGAGVAWNVGSVLGSGPAKMELSWRYFDLGSVTGGTTPLPGSGAGGDPVEALNFDLTDQVISVGLRIPL